jgi:hypothetical protein
MAAGRSLVPTAGWSPGAGGSHREGASIRVRYDRPGWYAEELEITDAAGAIDRAFAQVRVSMMPVPARPSAASCTTLRCAGSALTRRCGSGTACGTAQPPPHSIQAMAAVHDHVRTN